MLLAVQGMSVPDIARAQVPPAQRPAAQTAPAPAPAAQPSAPQRTETIVYENWVVTCKDTIEKSSKRTCTAALQIANQSKEVIFVWQLGQDETGKPAFALRTPLGVRIKEGVQVTLGTGKPRKVDFVACTQRGCEAAGPFDDAFAKELVTATEATVLFTLANGKAVNLKIPVKGIDKALPALKR